MLVWMNRLELKEDNSYNFNFVMKGETVSNHDEIMSKFFAQSDALSYGKTPEQLLGEKVPNHLIAHKMSIIVIQSTTSSSYCYVLRRIKMVKRSCLIISRIFRIL